MGEGSAGPPGGGADGGAAGPGSVEGSAAGPGGAKPGAAGPPGGELRLRAARREDADAVALLVHSTAEAMYERFAGDRDSSVRVLRAGFRRAGTGASGDVVTVAEVGGAVAGAMAAFPAQEIERRARRFMRLLLRRTPPWTWRETYRLYRLGAEVAPPPPPSSFYVDSLATDPRHRRRGVARALLAEAERRAREEG
ncbi:MAG TPA: GNAT family N-acetyltransferase, partial [Thermoleophilaceae bacterium]